MVIFYFSLLYLKEISKVSVVAQRLSSTMDGDEIIVMDGSSIVERGTHKAAMELEGLYFQLWKTQTS